MSVNLRRVRLRVAWQQDSYGEGVSPYFYLTGWKPSHLYEPTRADRKDVKDILAFINTNLKWSWPAQDGWPVREDTLRDLLTAAQKERKS